MTASLGVMQRAALRERGIDPKCCDDRDADSALAGNDRLMAISTYRSLMSCHRDARRSRRAFFGEEDVRK